MARAWKVRVYGNVAEVRSLPAPQMKVTLEEFIKQANLTEELCKLIKQWHLDADDPRPLHEAMGLTWEEYSHWVETCELPSRYNKVNG